MQKIQNQQVIFVINLDKIPNVTEGLLHNLVEHNGAIFGIKKEGYYMMNTNRVINNFQQTQEVENFNMFLQGCAQKGYSLAMIKI